MIDRLPYVILIGDVGAGKCTLIEKLAGITKMTLASNGMNKGMSATKTSDVIVSVDGSLIICDTPGTDNIIDKFSYNLEVARALNFMPVSLLLIIVKGNIRMAENEQKIREYLHRFNPEDFPKELIGFCITHMDTVKWTEDLLIHRLQSTLGIKKSNFQLS